MTKRIVSISLGVVVMLIIYFFVFQNKDNQFVSLEEYEVQDISIGDVPMKMYVSATQDKIVKGLSNVEKIEEDEGMLFIFTEEGERKFWMKDMNFPIDILWFDSNNKLVHIKKNALPENFPETYGEGIEAKYVMEFNAGFVDRVGIE